MSHTTEQILPAASHHRALPSTFTVYVDHEDLLLGVRRHSGECPIARATRRTLALRGYEVLGVSVGRALQGWSSVEVDVPAAYAMYRCRVGNWVGDFDFGVPCSPRAFEMEPMS